MTTEALLFLSELDPHAIGDAMRDATHYEAVPLAEFDALLDAANVRYEDYTFVDAGAGMGRALMLASRRPFKQILGIEISPALSAIARENVARWLSSDAAVRCRDVRIVCADATAYRYPPGNLLVFLYNPFGPTSVEKFARNLCGHEGELILCYHTAVHSEALYEGCTLLSPVERKPFGTIFVMGRP